MAEEKKNGAAQEEMGELFVNIGATGLGDLMKGLNAVSAGFLLTKNAAEQFTKPFRQIINQSTNAGVSLGQMQSQLGGSYEQLQQITAYLKSRNLNEGLINDIGKLQQVFQNFAMGGGIPDNLARTFNLLNIDWTNQTSDLENILNLIQTINERTKNLSKPTRLTHLSNMGISGEWGYAFDRPDFNLSPELVLNNKEIENLITGKEALNEFNVQLEKLGNILTSKILPVTTPVVKGINKLFSNKEVRDEYFKPNLKETIIELSPVGYFLNNWNKLKKLGEEGNNIKVIDGQKETLPQLPTAQPSLKETLPSNISNYTGGNRSFEIINNNYISSDSPKAAAREIENLDFGQIQRNQFEYENMPGI